MKEIGDLGPIGTRRHVMTVMRCASWSRSILLAGFMIAWTGTGLAQEAGEDNGPKFYAGHPQVESYVRQALERNPVLEESLARYRASLQKIPQVTSLPDPMLTFTQLIRSVETRVGPQLNTLAVSQKFPWFGTLDIKGRVASKAATALYYAHRANQRSVIVGVKEAIYQMGYLDHALELNLQEESLLGHYETVSQARYASGEGLQQAVIKIQAEITRILDRRETLNWQRRTAQARLNTLMDRPPEELLVPFGPIPLPEVNLNVQQLYQLGERHRQELKVTMEKIEGREQAIQLAEKRFWPEVTLGAGMVNVGGRDDPLGVLMPPPGNGKNAYSFSVGLNIPIRRNKYHAGLLEATESLIANRKSYLSIKNEMEFSIQDQVARLQTLRRQTDLFEKVLITQAEEALRSSESAYQTGQLGALDLLDSERILFELRLTQARYRADYLSALARLERALGTRFP